jgi:integrase
MRHGELLALRWQHVDLVAGRIVIRQNVVRGVIGTPKSGKPREIPLSNEARAALQAHRHLRGHSFASHLAMRGATLRVIQELLGHSTITMTMRYAHLGPEVGRDAVKLRDNLSANSCSVRPEIV